jgi:CubicO group peptidase (beta-lactamase class C family)
MVRRPGSVRRRRPRVVVLALVFWVAMTGSPALAQTDERLDASLTEQMPLLLERYGVSGSVVAAIENGDVAWARAYGLADVSEGTPMGPDLVFNFGSCGKMITAWAVMRLVEEGKVDLDAPVNRYLRRWQIESATYDAAEVTVARLLSHTSGLGVHGYLDRSPRRVATPDLVHTLSSVHLLEGLSETLDSGRLSFGNAELVQDPGSGYRYSGAGYGVLQLLVEDVTGEPFATFVQREITDPLGATSLRWSWTPELEDRAPTPYSEEGRPVEYRQLTMHGIGSTVGTVADFARFVAAGVTGPNGEPAGRGVLEPDTVARLTASWPEAGPDQGLAYPLGRVNYETRTVLHSGANTGWMAFFVLDTVSREGLVIASPSSRADPLHDSIFDLWLDAAYGPGTRQAQPPVPPIGWQSQLLIAVAAVLSLILAVAVIRFVQKRRAGHLAVRPLAVAVATTTLPWVGALLFGWYTIYSSLPLYLPEWYPDLWRTTGSDALMVTLAAWVAFSGVRIRAGRVPGRVAIAGADGPDEDGSWRRGDDP